jgi:hypothetical protein
VFIVVLEAVASAHALSSQLASVEGIVETYIVRNYDNRLQCLCRGVSMFSTARFLRGGLEKSSLLVTIQHESDQRELRFEWFENEDCENVVARFEAHLSHAVEEIHVPGVAIRASVLIEKVGTKGTDAGDHEVLVQAFGILQRYGLQGLSFKESCLYLTTTAGIESLATLSTLDLTACGLTEIPEAVATLTLLEELFVRRNKLAALPSFLGSMSKLKHLDADDNMIASLPGNHS